MQKTSFLNLTAAMILMILASACSSVGTEVTAKRSTIAIKMDGKLEDPIWYLTPAYELVHPKTFGQGESPEVRNFFRRGPVEPGKVRLLWDDKYLYIGVDFTDYDLAAAGNRDQGPNPDGGDAVAIFLKPLNKTWYWELYLNLRGNKTSYFYPGRGLFGFSGINKAVPALKGLKGAVFFKGTLNNSWDKDKKWTAEIAVPRMELAMAGEKLDPDIPWLICIVRINYGRYLPIPEKSSFPQLPGTNFHRHESYGLLKMIQ